MPPMGRGVDDLSSAPHRWLNQSRLLKHSIDHQHRFLAVRENFLQFLLRIGHILAGLFAGLAESRQLLGNRLRRRIFVIQSGSQISRGLAHGRRRGLVSTTAAATTCAAATTASAPAAATESAKATAAARLALRGHDLLDLGRNGFPLIVSSAKL